MSVGEGSRLRFNALAGVRGFGVNVDPPTTRTEFLFQCPGGRSGIRSEKLPGSKSKASGGVSMPWRAFGDSEHADCHHEL